MNNVSGILLMAGSSNRFSKDINKTLYQLDGQHLFLYSLEKFKQLDLKEIYLVIRNEDQQEILDILNSTGYEDVKIVVGGNERQDSVKNALRKVNSDYVLIHDAARPLTNIIL